MLHCLSPSHSNCRHNLRQIAASIQRLEGRLEFLRAQRMDIVRSHSAMELQDCRSVLLAGPEAELDRKSAETVARVLRAQGKTIILDIAYPFCSISEMVRNT